jgi:hypothetical protein
MGSATPLRTHDSFEAGGLIGYSKMEDQNQRAILLHA